MNNNEQNDLSYQRIQQLIKKQLDRIEHETDAKTEERPHKHNHTECSIIAIIKRFWRMRCLIVKQTPTSELDGLNKFLSKWKVYPVLSLKMTVKIGKN